MCVVSVCRLVVCHVDGWLVDVCLNDTLIVGCRLCVICVVIDRYCLIDGLIDRCRSIGWSLFCGWLNDWWWLVYDGRIGGFDVWLKH